MIFTREHTQLEVEYFIEKRQKFANYPLCQRDYVWKLGMQQQLIDTMLRGLPIPAVIIVVVNDPLRGQEYQVVDGQQRIETIRRFVNNEFPTAREFRTEPLLKPIAPGKSFSELNEADRTAILNYQIEICFIKNVREADIATIYRRLNRQLSLKISEVLYSYVTPTREQAERLVTNALWSDVYRGNPDRKRVYEMTLMVLMMEDRDIFVNMTTPRLFDTAASVGMRQLPPSLWAKCQPRLSSAARVYKGANFDAIQHIIPIYQSIMLLQEAGIDTDASPEAILAPWFNKLQVKIRGMQQQQGAESLYTRLTRVHEQRKFWMAQLPVVLAIPELVHRDTRRRFNTQEKLTAWIRQNGRCPICDKVLTMSDDGHHILPYYKGGETTADNCLLVHAECHPDAKLLNVPSSS